MKSGFSAVLFLLLAHTSAAAFATDTTLRAWVGSIHTVETQQKVLNRIFPGQIGSVRDARLSQDGTTYFFPKGGMWARLGKTFVAEESNSVNSNPYLVVPCMIYQNPDRQPTSAVTYLIHDANSRATPLSAGYSANEEIYKITLPKVGRVFLLLIASSENGSKGRQFQAQLYDLPKTGIGQRPKAVWTSARAWWSFQIGFANLGGPTETLVAQALTGDADNEFFAYRWNGSQFEEDDFASESTLRKLPESVWRYGAR